MDKELEKEEKVEVQEVHWCYFCGEDELAIRSIYDEEFPEGHENSFQIECPKCFCTGPIGDTEDEAVRKWNEAKVREQMEFLCRLPSLYV